MFYLCNRVHSFKDSTLCFSVALLSRSVCQNVYVQCRQSICPLASNSLALEHIGYFTLVMTIVIKNKFHSGLKNKQKKHIYWEFSVYLLVKHACKYIFWIPETILKGKIIAHFIIEEISPIGLYDSLNLTHVKGLGFKTLLVPRPHYSDFPLFWYFIKNIYTQFLGIILLL